MATDVTDRPIDCVACLSHAGAGMPSNARIEHQGLVHRIVRTGVDFAYLLCDLELQGGIFSLARNSAQPIWQRGRP